MGLFDESGTEIEPVETGEGISYSYGNIPNDWERRYAKFTVEDPGTVVEFRISPHNPSSGSYQYGAVAGAMLERSDSEFPSDFQGSDLTGMRQISCADTDGASFREKYWTRDCIHRCPQSSSSGCPSSQKIERCYWEAPFTLSQKDIESGRVLAMGGFAFGNYNYRLEDVAVNVVGVGVRNCSEQEGNACYGIGFVPYSMYHVGPFTIRNQAGSDVLVKLFDGRIEAAKALGAERYLTNPLSSADRDLLAPYLRQEFRGRPLDGHYVVRLWEDDGFDFDAVQDVQLLINYRYWTPAE